MAFVRLDLPTWPCTLPARGTPSALPLGSATHPPPSSGAPATQVELEVRAAAQEVLGHVQEAYNEAVGELEGE